MTILNTFNKRQAEDVTLNEIIKYMYPILDHLSKQKIEDLCKQIQNGERPVLESLKEELNMVSAVGNMGYMWATTKEVQTGEFKAFIIGHSFQSQGGVIVYVVKMRTQEKLARRMRVKGFSLLEKHEEGTSDNYIGYMRSHKPDRPYILDPFGIAYYTYSNKNLMLYWFEDHLNNPFFQESDWEWLESRERTSD